MKTEESLSEAQLVMLAKMVDELGERETSERLGVGIDSLLRVLARRTNVRRGTIALLQRELEQIVQEKNL